jgi:hypothetical protein
MGYLLDYSMDYSMACPSPLTWLKKDNPVMGVQVSLTPGLSLSASFKLFFQSLALND